NCVEKDHSVISIRCKDMPKLMFDTIPTLTDMDYVVFHGTVNVGASEAYQIDSRKAQFVYVTDLYRSAPPALMAEADKTKTEEKDGTLEEKGGASGSAVTTILAAEQVVSRSSTSFDDRRLNLRAEASPSSLSKRRKGMC
ncbi:hypothetical protein KI387_021578, partial [Taxus chinensis]